MGGTTGGFAVKVASSKSHVTIKYLVVLVALALVGNSAPAAEDDAIRKTVNPYLEARASHHRNVVGTLIARDSLGPVKELRQRALHAGMRSLCTLSLSMATRTLVVQAKYGKILANIEVRTLAGLGVVDQPYMQEVSRNIQIADITSSTAIALIGDSASSLGQQKINLILDSHGWRILLEPA